MWKRKLGSSGTYNKLIEIFECAGFKSYADSVIRIMSESLGEIEMNIGKFMQSPIYIYSSLYSS
jgi:hypothetical protein